MEIRVQPKTTIHDVARAAGVSVTTVSQVLAGKGRISSDTVARVTEAAEQLGYRRNPSAAALRGAGSGVIGLIVRDLRHPFYAALAAGLGEALEEAGKTLLLSQSGAAGERRQQCVEALMAQGVEGIVLGGDVKAAAALAAQAQGVPVICASRASAQPEMDLIQPDNRLGGHLATEQLIAQGHRHIAWLGGRAASQRRAERIGGYCAALLQHALPLKPEWMVECAENQAAAMAAAMQLTASYPALTAIVASDYAVAQGAWIGLLRGGRARDISLVGFCEEASLQPGEMLTLIASPAQAIGRAAAARMLLRLSAPALPAQHIIVPPTRFPGDAA